MQKLELAFVEAQLLIANCCRWYCTAQKARSTFKEHSTSKDTAFRRYVCSCVEDRDDIIEDIFRASFNATTLGHEYRVIKVNMRGRRQERIFKLTCDSLLNLDKRTIKVDEIHTHETNQYCVYRPAD
jgi:hypothetical protein